MLGTLLLLVSVLLPAGFVWLQFALHLPARVFIAADGSAFLASECDAILRVLEDAAGERVLSGGPPLWDSAEESQHYLPTKEVRVAELPALVAATRPGVDRTLGLLRRLYPLEGARLRLADLYVARYDADGGVSGLQLHVDAYTLSFSVALNAADEYGGGGLEFDALGQVRREPQGNALLFPSKLLHRGVPVARHGTRFALIGLVSVGEDELWAAGAGAPPASRLHGMFARCASLEEVGAGGERAAGRNATELCSGWADTVASHARNRFALLWRAGSSEDLLELAVLNAGLLVGAVLLRQFVL